MLRYNLIKEGDYMRKIVLFVLLFSFVFALSACELFDIASPISPDSCEIGEILVDEECVTDDTIVSCPTGQEVIEGECKDKIDPLECLDTEELINGECKEKEIPLECLESQVIVDGVCVDIVVPETDLEYAQWVIQTQSDTVVEIKASNESMSYTGSGVIYKNDGNTYYIVTNRNLVFDATTISITLFDSTVIAAQYVYDDYYSNVAVLSFESSRDLDVAVIDQDNDLAINDIIVSIGNLNQTYETDTLDLYVVLDQYVSTEMDGFKYFGESYIQHNNVITANEDGGGLFNLDGELVGLNIYYNVEGYIVGYAISLDVLNKVLPYLETGNPVQRISVRAEALISIDDIFANWSTYYPVTIPVGITSGLYVKTPGDGILNYAGFLHNDIILTVNGIAITDLYQFMNLIQYIYDMETDMVFEISRDYGTATLYYNHADYQTDYLTCTKEIDSSGSITYTEKFGNTIDGYKLEYRNNGDVLYTYYVNGVINGYTYLYLANGDVISETYIDGVKQSNVSIWYANGDEYSGPLSNNLPEGTGTMWFNDGGVYQGGFSNGLFHGQGTYWYPSNIFYNYITGSFANGNPTGTSTMWFNGGQTYFIAEFIDINNSNSGTIYFDDGTSMSGTFEDGMIK